MGKKIDIDEYLQERSVEIVLNGKTFHVKDVDIETKKLIQAENVDEKKVVMKLLSCTEKDLEGYGLAAFTAIINQVTRNLFQTSSQENQ